MAAQHAQQASTTSPGPDSCKCRQGKAARTTHSGVSKRVFASSCAQLKAGQPAPPSASDPGQRPRRRHQVAVAPINSSPRHGKHHHQMLQTLSMQPTTSQQSATNTLPQSATLINQHMCCSSGKGRPAGLCRWVVGPEKTELPVCLPAGGAPHLGVCAVPVGLHQVSPASLRWSTNRSVLAASSWQHWRSAFSPSSSGSRWWLQPMHSQP